MTETTTSEPVPFVARFGPLLALGALLVAAVVAIALVVRLAGQEQARDLRAWQDRLGIVADSRLAAIEGWLDGQRASVRGLADNASVQLYMTELDLAGGDPTGVTDEAAQRAYLRNLLVAAAARDGFEPSAPVATVDANVERPATAGLALADARGRIIVATPAMPALDARARAAIAAAVSEPALIDLHAGAGGAPTMGFVAPVRAIQGAQGGAPIGYVIGVKDVGGALYPLLRQPGSIARTVETVLLRRDGARIELLSPQTDGTPGLGKSVGVETPDLAEVAAVEGPGGFIRAFDHAGVAVLAVSRAVQGPPWVLMTKVAADEALSTTEGRRAAMITISLLVIGGLAAVLVAAWRHGTSRREALAARRARELAAKLDAQHRFLTLVTDSQPVGLAMLDSGETVRWANRALGALAGTTTAEVTGKPVAQVFGPLPARVMAASARQARAEHGPVETTLALPSAGRDAVVRARFIPVAPEAGADRVLMVAEDVTPVVEARERRVRLMRQLVATLVKVIDRRDPFAADHSAWVSQVAQAIAEEMELDPAMVETVSIAGQLMNLGKILVPEALLTRGGRLSEAELDQVREALRAGADLVEGVEFDGPVALTLRQLQERWDGQGQPAGLAGDAILLSARVVAVANAFVGMVSRRSWRAGLAVDDAVERLMADRGQIFDPNVVLALANRVANRGGAAEWSRIGARPEGA